jgi:hypothetical protein
MKVLFPAFLVVYSLFGVLDYQDFPENRSNSEHVLTTSVNQTPTKSWFMDGDRCWRLEPPRFPAHLGADLRVSKDCSPFRLSLSHHLRGNDPDTFVINGQVWRWARCRCPAPEVEINKFPQSN